MPLAPGLKNKVLSAYLLAEREKALATAAGDNGATVSVPPTAPDATATVVVPQLAGAPTVEGQ